MQQEIVSGYKKKGLFDSKRKEWFESVAADAELQTILAQLVRRLVEVKIEKDPELVIKDCGSGASSGKLSALIQTELVKRQVTTGKKAQKRTGDAPSDVSTPVDISAMTETELLDAINNLVADAGSSLQQQAPVTVD